MKELIDHSLQVNLHVSDLFVELRDGKVLLKLLELISGEKLGRVNKGTLRVMKMENVGKALRFLSTKVSCYFLLFIFFCLQGDINLGAYL